MEEKIGLVLDAYAPDCFYFPFLGYEGGQRLVLLVIFCQNELTQFAEFLSTVG